MPRTGSLLAGAYLAAGCAGLASAGEYCVTCEGPPGMYRCIVDGAPEGPGKDPRVSLHCISEIARQGNHERCAVSRGAPFPCPGLTALVTPPAGGERPPDMAAPHEPVHEHEHGMSREAGPSAEPDDAETADTGPAPATKVPRTMEELAGQTIGGPAKKAGEMVGQTGSAIGKAAVNTWTCITSLFTSCGTEDEATPVPE